MNEQPFFPGNPYIESHTKYKNHVHIGSNLIKLGLHIMYSNYTLVPSAKPDKHVFVSCNIISNAVYINFLLHVHVCLKYRHLFTIVYVQP